MEENERDLVSEAVSEAGLDQFDINDQTLALFAEVCVSVCRLVCTCGSFTERKLYM